ncbi:uncharacterized protein [Arachis hypogaea]|uniref:uncharacterized protein isoform X3 n=1 Tax=Arachis hypogaea TaxID=3818 RepID=UPI003B21006A
MGFLCSLTFSIQFLLLFSSSLFTNCFTLNDLTSTHHHECHQHESNALLSFKQSFIISKSASYNPSSYPKTLSWSPSTDCCSWDGIECDELTGHVISIDLSSSLLYGSMDPNSTLFSLVHLQSLDLSDNDFNHSQIPAKIGDLSQLSYLNLSQVGETTLSEIIKNFRSMTLSNTSDPAHFKDDVYYLQHSLIDIELLSFSMSNKGVVMDYLGVQYLHHMVAVDLSCNKIYGEIPDTMGSLNGLVVLNLSNNMFTGSIPSSFGKLSNLEVLDLSLNNLSGNIPQQLTGLTFLDFFNVSFNNLSGPIPESGQLSTFDDNSFKGNNDLCGIQLVKKCKDHSMPPLPTPEGNQDFESGSFFKSNWMVILIGYGGGLLAGLALGNAFAVDVYRLLKRIF